MGKKIKLKDVAKKTGLQEDALRDAFHDQGLIEEKDAKFVDQEKVVYFHTSETAGDDSRKIMFHGAMGNKVAYLALAFMILAGAVGYLLGSGGSQTFNTASYETVIEQIQNDLDLLKEVKEVFCK